MELDTFLDHPSRFEPFNSPLSGRPGNPVEVLATFREGSARRSAGFVVASAKEFATRADEVLDGISSERATLDAFGYLAADLRRAMNSLKAIGVMSDNLKERLLIVHTELVEAARKAVDRTALSLSDIEARMREFIEMAKPKVQGYREFFEHAQAELEKTGAKYAPLKPTQTGA